MLELDQLCCKPKTVNKSDQITKCSGYNNMTKEVKATNVDKT